MQKNLALTLCLVTILAPTTSAFAKDGASHGSFSKSEAVLEAFGETHLEQTEAGLDKSSSLAVLTFYNDRATFEAAAPGLKKEDFEGGTAGPGQVVGCGSPLTSAASPCYAAGELESGFGVVASSGTNVVALGPGTVPINPTTWVASDLFADTTSLSFSDPDVFAVGLDIFDFFGAPTVTISIFSANGLEGQGIATSGGFFGVVSDTPIVAIELGTGTNVIVLDNVCFGRGIIDTDGDGLPDDEDACPESDLSPTVVIDSCDSGVDNSLGADGCTISDLIGECADGANNHGQFVSCVSHLTNDLKRAGVISGRDKGAIMSCAGQADIP